MAVIEFLTFEEYKELSTDPVDEEKFGPLNKKATQIINQATRQFYHFEDFEEDLDWRKETVKTAAAVQIDFFVETGMTTLEEMQSKPLSFSAGRTSITNSNSQSQQKTRTTLLSADAQNLLNGTGLLYRGIDRLC